MVKFGKVIGRAIEELITIVSPSTFYCWIRDGDKDTKNSGKTKGGQRKPKELRELVIQIAQTTGFGYTRIIGELRKLGIKKISRQTIRRILKEVGIEPGPDRTSESWDNFVKRHAETLWAVDFFLVRTVTSLGLKRMNVMVFLCMETREIICSTSTEHPNSAWVTEQTTLFLDQTENRDHRPEIVIHDRDTKFSKEFTAKLKSRSVRTNVLPKASPNLNGRCERAIQTIKLGCLSKFVVFDDRYLDYLLADFTEYDNSARSSMVRDHLPPTGEQPDEVATIKLEDIEVNSYVGGLVKGFERKAA